MRPHRLDEWMRTGDFGMFDADGFVTVTGRAKDLIIRGGVNIAPLEIDAVLIKPPEAHRRRRGRHPGPIYGEEIAAFVVPRGDETVRPEDIIAHCRGALPAFKAPKSVHLIEALPRSDRGKIRRKALKDIWLAGDSRP